MTNHSTSGREELDERVSLTDFAGGDSLDDEGEKRLATSVKNLASGDIQHYLIVGRHKRPETTDSVAKRLGLTLEAMEYGFLNPLGENADYGELIRLVRTEKGSEGILSTGCGNGSQ